MSDLEAPRVRRLGRTALRPVERWTPAVALLLQHFERVGIVETPRHLGYDGDGHEVVSWIDGDAGAASWAQVVPMPGLRAMAHLLRRLHDASEGFVLPSAPSWADSTAPHGAEVVCHGDFGPWNIAWNDGRPAGVFDWDMAYSGTRIEDVAYALSYVAPFQGDEFAMRWLAHPGPPDRLERIRTFWDAYSGIPATDADLERLVDAVPAAQERTRDLALRLAAEGVEPQATWVREGREALWRDQIAWSRANRDAILAC